MQTPELLRMRLLPRSGLVVCRACSTAWGCKSPAQPDGGEVRAKRKGVAARRGLKAGLGEDAGRWTRTGYEACVPDERA